jgi:peptidoglycan hydrolase-like protein with peptidoglycan-binding domain
VVGARPALVVAAIAALGVAAPVAHARSSATAALQVALRAKGVYGGTVDGVLGPVTREGVRRFQSRRGLAVDGIAGPRTRRALGWRGRHRFGSRTIRSGNRGWDVAALQWLLATHGFPNGPFDGDFGPRGEAALVKFQTWAGLGADGLAGPATFAALRRPPPRSVLRFAMPIAAAVGDGFGPRADEFHPGLDFPAPRGTPVSAGGAGCVTSAGYDAGGYGRLVVLGHSAGMTSWYAHLSRISVSVGQCLSTGSPIGRVGSTGRSTGPHLHFELRVRGAAVDPRTGL